MRYLSMIAIGLFLTLACSKDDCERPKQCKQDPDPGPCEAYIPAYYFDEDEGKCKEFIYGGCDGNVPYETMEACWECECDKRLE